MMLAAFTSNAYRFFQHEPLGNMSETKLNNQVITDASR